MEMILREWETADLPDGNSNLYKRAALEKIEHLYFAEFLKR